MRSTTLVSRLLLLVLFYGSNIQKKPFCGKLTSRESKAPAVSSALESGRPLTKTFILPHSTLPLEPPEPAVSVVDRRVFFGTALAVRGRVLVCEEMAKETNSSE